MEVLVGRPHVTAEERTAWRKQAELDCRPPNCRSIRVYGQTLLRLLDALDELEADLDDAQWRCSMCGHDGRIRAHDAQGKLLDAVRCSECGEKYPLPRSWTR